MSEQKTGFNIFPHDTAESLNGRLEIELEEARLAAVEEARGQVEDENEWDGEADYSRRVDTRAAGIYEDKKLAIIDTYNKSLYDEERTSVGANAQADQMAENAQSAEKALKKSRLGRVMAKIGLVYSGPESNFKHLRASVADPDALRGAAAGLNATHNDTLQELAYKEDAERQKTPSSSNS